MSKIVDETEKIMQTIISRIKNYVRENYGTDYFRFINFLYKRSGERDWD